MENKTGTSEPILVQNTTFLSNKVNKKENPVQFYLESWDVRLFLHFMSIVENAVLSFINF